VATDRSHSFVVCSVASVDSRQGDRAATRETISLGKQEWNQRALPQPVIRARQRDGQTGVLRKLGEHVLARCGSYGSGAWSSSCRWLLFAATPMVRCIWVALILSPALKNTPTTPRKPHPITSVSTARHLRAAAIAWAAPPQPISRPSSASLRQNSRRDFTTTQSPRPYRAGRSCPSPVLPDPGR
jgi:hypothetical protein